MSKFKKYWKELQRRHVVKAGIAYIVFSWLIVQVITVLLPLFKIPDRISQTVVIILAVGFPIWLIIAWVYDFSWGSIQKTEDVPFDPEISRKKNAGLNRVIIGGLSIAVILLLVNTFYMRGQMDDLQNTFKDVLATNYASSIAVMAFDDLSPKQDQDYFARGLSQQIQQRLTKHKDLKVINTNSTFDYQGKDISIPVIGKELDVAYVLEGSVLKSGETFRVNLQLVSTKDGSNIWSKQFDQKLEDVLYTIDEIAGSVVQFLSLTFKYQDVRLRKVDPEAFELYLRSHELVSYNQDSTSVLADSLIRKSIDIDPTYARSWAALCMTTLHKGVYYGYYEMEEAITIGLRSAKQAIELDPEIQEGYQWLSNWQWHNREVQASNDNLEKALKLETNNSDILMYASFQAQRSNKIKEAMALCEKAIVLDPKNADAWMGKYETEMMIDFTSAELSIKSFMELSPQALINKYMESYIVYNAGGDVNKAFEILNEQPDLYYRLMVRSLILFSENKKEEAFSTLDLFMNLSVEEHPEHSVFDFEAAIIYAHLGNNDQAFYYLDKAYDDIVVTSLEWFFTWPPFKNLYNDPRWDEYIDRLSDDFNYDFPHQPE